MNHAAVLGSPITHSLSPVLHGAAYDALGLTDWEYTAHEVDAEGLGGFVGGLDDTWRGLSLTMPLKERALALADRAAPTAVLTGAANTLVRSGSTWEAENTDVVGLVRALESVDHRGRAVLLGSGATARSAVVALARLGVREVSVAARNAAAVDDLLRLARGQGVGAGRVALAEWARHPAGLVVSTLAPGASESAGEHLREAATDHHGGTLLDVVYAGWPTPLARCALDSGMTVVSGLEMLVHQGAEQFRLFTGQQAPVEAMRSAGLAALGRTAS